MKKRRADQAGENIAHQPVAQSDPVAHGDAHALNRRCHVIER